MQMLVTSGVANLAARRG